MTKEVYRSGVYTNRPAIHWRTAMQLLYEHRRKLTRQQLLTLRGQVLAGDVDGAMKGLARIVQSGGDT